MRRLPFVAFAMFVTTACGGGQPAESATAADPAAEPSGSQEASGGQEEASGGGAPDNEFQLQDSETAQQARGAHPSEIEATPTHAAMRLFVVDPDAGPIPGIVIKVTAPDGRAYYTGETDSVGYAEVLVPAGQRYEMEYLSLGRRNIAASVEVRSDPNLDIRLTLRYRRQRGESSEAGRVVLDGVLFDTNRATIKAESYPRVDRVVEYMTHRPNARIRVAGHTDNVGNPRRNQALSEARAQAVRAYIIEHGIDSSRIEAVGYGDQRPAASNDTEGGRQRNRRIEAIEL